MSHEHFKIEESIKLEVAELAGKECTSVAERDSPQLLKRIIAEKKRGLQAKIALGPVNINKLEKNPYLIRATQHYEQFQELSSLLSEEDEKLDAMDENLDKISERMEGAESKVQELAREVEMIGDEQRIDALADQYARKFAKMSNNFNYLLQAAESSEAKRDKAKNVVQNLQRKMVRIAEGVEGIPSVKAAADIQFDKLSEAIKVKKGRVAAIATEKEALEDNMRMKKDDIAKEHVSANSQNKNIESTNSSLDRTTEELAKEMALNSELKERLRSKPRTSKPQTSEPQTSEPAKASKRKVGATTTEPEPAKRRRGRK